MRKIIASLLISLIVSVAGGCTTVAPLIPTPAQTPVPEDTVKGFMDAIVSGDFAAATEFCHVSIEESLETLEASGEEAQQLIDAIFARVTYQIGNKTITGDEAVVSTTIIAPDLLQITGSVMMEVLPQVFALAFSGATEEVLNKLFLESFMSRIESSEAPLLTSEVDIKLTLQEGKWLIDPDDSLVTALTGGNLNEVWEEFDNN